MYIDLFFHVKISNNWLKGILYFMPKKKCKSLETKKNTTVMHSFHIRWWFFENISERIPTPEVFPENESSDNVSVISSQRDWLPTTIVGIMILSASLIM